jgi:hypothetical protein
MKVVINTCFGGFGLSLVALSRYNDLANTNVDYYYDIKRNDPCLVQVVEELGKQANGDYTDLKIVDIPDGISWYIQEYDGLESIHETHRIWD